MNRELEIFTFGPDDSQLKKQKSIAREIRRSQWWKRRCAKGVCYYCNNQFPPKELTMDHIVPLSRGGKSVKNNLAPCCKTCNNKKKQLLPMEWQEYLSRMASL